MSFHEGRKVLILGIIGAVVVSILGLSLPFILSSRFEFSERIGLAQLSFSAAAFLAIFITFLIKVAFNEKGEQQATLNHKDGKVTNSLPSLWLINEGNAVARYFQIDFIIPENIGKQSVYKSITREDGQYIISYTNDGKKTLFVNRPFQDPNISAAIDTKKCIDKDSFEIKYRVYGDWAETQEGKLKVNIHKQQEAT
jgi:hypothetical protein